MANLKNLSFQAERFLIDIWHIMKIDVSEESQPVHVKDIEHGGELDEKAFSPITYKKVVYVFILCLYKFIYLDLLFIFKSSSVLGMSQIHTILVFI